jgi:hypothetical protein
VDSYEWQLDTSSNFISGQFQTGIKVALGTDPNDVDTEHQLTNLIHGQTYYWKVRSNTAGVASDWSETWSFTVAENGVGFEDITTDVSEFSIFPNPANHMFTIQNTDVNDAIIVYDLVGKKVYSNFASSTLHNVDVSNWRKGVYLVEVNGDKQKVIVQ